MASYEGRQPVEGRRQQGRQPAMAEASEKRKLQTDETHVDRKYAEWKVNHVRTYAGKKRLLALPGGLTSTTATL